MHGKDIVHIVDNELGFVELFVGGFYVLEVEGDAVELFGWEGASGKALELGYGGFIREWPRFLIECFIT
jgi:hypothetical protein